MFALLLLATIASSTTITIPSILDDTGKYVQFHMYDIDECYLRNTQDSVKITENDNGYNISIYESTDCTGSFTESIVETFKEEALAFSGAIFSSDEACDVEDSELLVEYEYFSVGCISKNGFYTQYETDGKYFYLSTFTSDSCVGGTVGLPLAQCGNCTTTSITVSSTTYEGETYVICGSAFTSIIVAALAIFLVIF
ncbi:hypothetical protein QTN25_007282 [Entamoeba marina]